MAGCANRRIRLLLFVFVLVFAGVLVRAAWLQGVRARVARTARGEPAAGDDRDPGRPRHDLRPQGRPARDRRAGDDGLRQPARRFATRAPRRSLPQQHARRSSPDASSRSSATARAASSTSRARPIRSAATRSQRRHSPGSASTRRSGASTRRTASRRRCSATRASTTAASPGSSSSSTARSPGEPAKRDGRQGPVRRRRSTSISSTVRSGTGSDVVPDDRPHDPGERRERAARDGRAQWHAKAATAIVLDPRTGADPRDGDRARLRREPFPIAPQELQRNRAVTDTYEPGSTFKLVTVAGALSEGLVTPQTRVHAARTRSRSPTASSTTPSRAAPSDDGRADPLPLVERRRDHARPAARRRDGSRSGSRASGSAAATGIDFPGESPGHRPAARPGGRARRSATCRSGRESP